jgi:hypothetical protein
LCPTTNRMGNCKSGARRSYGHTRKDEETAKVEGRDVL